MALSVNIDFENTYDIGFISDDLKTSFFKTELQDGSSVELKIEISNESHELMAELYNLAFGPIDEKGHIDDKAELPHKDYSKVFSTILLEALTYLSKNNSHYIGIDGSAVYRAYLYFRFIQRNYDYLNNYFNIFGLKYYVRITRFGKTQYQNPFDFNDIFTKPQKIEKFKKGERINIDSLYNYFIFNLKEQIIL
jgi:hypothetical protein